MDDHLSPIICTRIQIKVLNINLSKIWRALHRVKTEGMKEVTLTLNKKAIKQSGTQVPGPLQRI